MKMKHRRTGKDTSQQDTQSRDSRDTRQAALVRQQRILAKVQRVLQKQLPPPLPREEWDFKKCPQNELLACWEYESARESKTIQSKVAAYRKASEAERREHWNLWEQQFPGILTFCPEFPSVPWLSIPTKERAQRCPSWQSNIGSEPVSDYKALNLQNDVGGFDMRKTFGEGLGAETYSVFRIPWGRTDAQLVRIFARWLKDNRPEEAQPEARGRNELRSTLKRLGAYRLLRHYKGDWAEAQEATEAIRGSPLYKGQASWDTAATEALRWIRSLKF